MAASRDLTPAERSLRSSAAAHVSWANTDDRAARLKPASAGFLRKLGDQVDPEHKLDPVERGRRAEHLRKAHLKSAALKSAKARRLRAQSKGAA